MAKTLVVIRGADFAGFVPHGSRHVAFGEADVDGIPVCFSVLFMKDPRWVCVWVEDRVPFLGSLLVTGVGVSRGEVMGFLFVTKAGTEFNWEGDVKSLALNILLYAAVSKSSGV